MFITFIIVLLGWTVLAALEASGPTWAARSPAIRLNRTKLISSFDHVCELGTRGSTRALLDVTFSNPRQHKVWIKAFLPSVDPAADSPWSTPQGGQAWAHFRLREALLV